MSSFLLTLFFVVSLIEIIAESNGDKDLVWYSKPLVIPILVAYYFRRSKVKNQLFIVALLFSWVANLFFIGTDYQDILLGSVFFMVYRILILYIVIKKVKAPGVTPAIIGSLPFVFVYLFVSVLTADDLQHNIYLFWLHGIFVIILGGFSLGNMIISTSKSNVYLFISSIFFAVTQFLFVLKFFRYDANLLQAFAMALFVMGQFLLIKFMFLIEKNRYGKYEIIKDLKEVQY